MSLCVCVCWCVLAYRHASLSVQTSHPWGGVQKVEAHVYQTLCVCLCVAGEASFPDDVVNIQAD